MGRWHVDALLQRQDVQLVAACDVAPRALEGLPGYTRRYADWRELVADTTLDGASVILPHYLYPEVVGGLLRKGVHVLKEKPFARNLADAVAMCRAAKASDRQLVIAGQHKFKGSFVTAREHLGELGGIFLTRANILYRADAIAVDGVWSWRGIRAQSGGVAIVDSGWHILEMLALTRGLPERVIAVNGTMRVSPGVFDVDEQAALILQYADGGIATVLASFVTTPGEIRMVFYGLKGSLDLDLEQDKLAWCAGSERKDLVPAEGLNPAVHMYDLFLESMRTGKPSPGDWREAIGVQRIIEAAYRSVAQGSTPVELADVSAVI
jgi:predicted dehydrogenase